MTGNRVLCPRAKGWELNNPACKSYLSFSVCDTQHIACGLNFKSAEHWQFPLISEGTADIWSLKIKALRWRGKETVILGFSTPVQH